MVLDEVMFYEGIMGLALWGTVLLEGAVTLEGMEDLEASAALEETLTLRGIVVMDDGHPFVPVRLEDSPCIISTTQDTSPTRSNTLQDRPEKNILCGYNN